ncbi:hypothetical protein [Thermomonas sp.]|uniref:hypothetical protein n=1 Tax=Thermomonas sp. TaxID=1971895 RepID=UPI0024877668|nr:hypothetical protein [Thermomonas sp.]MDI1253313.1 hypothetical protein [Thermomonas sp.]
MAIYLLPTPKNGYVERPSRVIAASGISTEDLAMPEPNTANDVGKAERFTRWKALQVESIKGVMRWV